MENKGRNKIQNLIADRKARLSYFITMQAFERLSGKRTSTLSDVTEAVKDNEETDQLMKEWAWENIDLPYCIDNEIAF